MLFLALFICVPAKAAFTLTHQTGAYDALQDNGKGIMMQQVHTDYQILYARPGEKVFLYRPERSTFVAYCRWYCYDTDQAVPETYSEDDAPLNSNDNPITTRVESTWSKDVNRFIKRDRGWFSVQYYDNRTQSSDSYFQEIKYTMHKGDSIYRIACDEGLWEDLTWNKDGASTEPTLSKRIIYEIRPAKWMADTMELCKVSPENPTNDRYVEEHELIAPTGRKLYIGPDYMYRGSGSKIILQQYRYYCRSNYHYYSSQGKIAIPSTDANWIWYKDGVEDPSIHLSDSAAQFAPVYRMTPGTVTYTLKYNSSSDGYYFNVARFKVTYVDVNEVGPVAKLPPPTNKMEKIYEENFNYDRPGVSTPTFWLGHFDMDESTYGYYNKNLDGSTSYRRIRKGNVTWSEYAVTNAKTIWIKGDNTDPFVYQHVDSTENVPANGEEGYMIYCDGSQQSGLVFNLQLHADLCPGSTMYFSAWLCDLSSEKTYSNPGSADYWRSAPNMDFVVTGIDDKGKEHKLATFTTGEFGYNAVQSADQAPGKKNRMERGKWYQIMFPVKFDAGNTYHTYRLRITNKSTSSDGNDFAIDDIRIYVQKPPVMPLQASTSDCIDKAVDSIRAYLRIDYQEIDHNGDPLYYQWREGNNIVHNAYYNVDGPSNDFGKVNIKPDASITAADTCSDLFTFDKRFRETKEPVVRYIKEQVDNMNERYVMYIAMPMEVRINRNYTGFVSQQVSELGKREGCGTFADLVISGGTRITINDEITLGDSVVTVCGHREYSLNIVLTKIIQDERQGELRVDTAHCRADWLIGDSAYVDAHPEIYKYSFEDIHSGLGFYRQKPKPAPAAVQMVDFLMKHSLLILDTAGITMSPGISLTYTAFPLEGSAKDMEADTIIPICTTPRFLKIKPAVPASNMMVVGTSAEDDEGLPEVVQSRPRIVRISDAQRREGWFDVPLYRIGKAEESYVIDSVYTISSNEPNWHSVKLIPDHHPMLVTDIIHFGNKEDKDDPVNAAIQSLKPGYDYTFHVAFVGESDEDKCDRGYTYFTLRIVPDVVTWIGGDWNLDASWDYAIPMDTTNVALMPDSNYNVTFAADPAESFDFNYIRNKCRNIYIPAGASMKGQENIEIRGNAFVDVPVPAQKWALTSMPIKGIVSGDLFVSHNESTDPFVVANIQHGATSETAIDRAVYEVYNSPYDAATNSWVRADSILDRPIRPYDAVMVAADYASGLSSPVIRLPKPDNYYRYYDFNTNLWLTEDKTITEDLRTQLGKPAWNGEETITLARANDKNIYMFGNPTFGYIDLTQLVADNDKLTGKYFMTPAEGTSDPTIDLATIDPSAAHVLLPPCRGVLLEGSGDDEITITINVTTPPATPVSPAPKRRMQTSSTFDAQGGMPIGAIGSPIVPGVVVDIDEWSMTIGTELSPWLDQDIPTLRMNRELYRDGAYNTICLPFSMTDEQIDASPLTGAEIYEFTSAIKTSDLQLEIEVSPTDHIDAGVPYLIKWAPTTPEIIPMPLVFTNVHIDDIEGHTLGAPNAVQFVGSVPRKLMVYEDKNNLFVGANDILYWPNTHNPLRGFRAYFQVPVGGPVGVPKNTHARIIVRSNTPTGIEGITPSENNVQKFMIDGNVYILRDGKLYTILGQTIE